MEKMRFRIYDYDKRKNEIIKDLVYEGLNNLFGDMDISQEYRERVDDELNSIFENNFTITYLLAYELANKAKEDGDTLGFRGSVGTSLVAYSLGITDIDPIKYKIPIETFVGNEKDRSPYIYLNFSEEYKDVVQKNMRNILNVEILGDNTQTMIDKLEALTGIKAKDIRLDDEKVFNIICDNSEIITDNITEFDTKWVKKMLQRIQPKTIEELAKCEGFINGTDVWIDNAEELLNAGISLNEVIANRDDIMNYLIGKGVEKESAFHIMEFVRKGRARKAKNVRTDYKKIWNEYVEIMKEYKVPDWYIDSCEKISYLFPKAHSINNAIVDYKLAWYKLYFPKEFDEVFLEYKLVTSG